MPRKEFGFLFFQSLKVGGTVNYLDRFIIHCLFFNFRKNLKFLRWSEVQSHCFL